MSRYKTLASRCALLILGLLCSVQAQIFVKPLHPDYTYPISYKDHVYTSLSDNAKAIFYAINIHPSCVAKKGQCIPRGKCIEKKMLYISRVCYWRDLVCCYVEIVREPVVEHITQYPPPTKKPLEIEV